MPVGMVVRAIHTPRHVTTMATAVKCLIPHMKCELYWKEIHHIVAILTLVIIRVVVMIVLTDIICLHCFTHRIIPQNVVIKYQIPTTAIPTTVEVISPALQTGDHQGKFNVMVNVT